MTKAITTLVLALTGSLLGIDNAGAPKEATAAPIAYEGFAYPAGSLPGNNGGSGFIGAWAGDVGVVVQPGLGLQHALALPSAGSMIGGGFNANRNLSATITQDTFWASFLIEFDPGNDQVWLGFDVVATALPMISFGRRLDFYFIQNGSNAPATTPPGSASPAGVTDLLIARITRGGAFTTVDLWVNKPPTGVPDLTHVFGGVPAPSIVNTQVQPGIFSDEIRIGTTAADVAAGDVDGPDDCLRPSSPIDFGDAPDDVLAYPLVTGAFPTCLAAGPAGNQTWIPGACPPISSAPGAANGFVRHEHPAADRYWLGCPPASNPPQGIDPEADGKVNDTGGPLSACNNTIGVDCTEIAFGMSFGQDECYGPSDAGLAAAPTIHACGPGNVNWTISAYSCATANLTAYLNILVDWNQDGDWNDVFVCAGSCAYEWAVKNYTVTLAPGCNTIFPPTFRVGPLDGPGWMRITLSDGQVPDDFPWNGSAGILGQSLHNGETEDYPVTILPAMVPCPSYEDWGDAPEDAEAYPGSPGNFPTCSLPGGTGTQQSGCLPPRSSVPGPTGYVRHLAAAADDFGFWLGCFDPVTGTLGVDSELNGKTNDTGLPPSLCDPNVAVDCTEPSILSWGQDECYGDGVDAGVDPPWISFNVCQPGTVNFKTFNCQDEREVFLNILVDMNGDGDWNDNFLCAGSGACAYEWAVKNELVVLRPGCETHASSPFLVGPNAGRGWLRITLTSSAVSDDFPWDGSAGPSGNGFFSGGETEDYLAVIRAGGVGVGDAPRVDEISLAPPSPNPGRDEILVRFALPREAEVSLAAFDLAGRKLADLAGGRLPAGEHRVKWNFRDASGREFAAGYYVVKLRVGDRVLTRRGIRLR